MTVNLVVMPAGPALVRELAPADSVGEQLLAEVRQLVSTARAAVPDQPIHLVGSRDARWATALTGSLAAWGAPQVRVGGGNHLPELVQRYALGTHVERVAQARGTLGTINPQALTIVAIDGSAGLTARAPLALLDDAPAADTWCRQVLTGHPPQDGRDASSLRGAGVLEPGLGLELAALRPRRARLIAADTTLGVGRYVAGWEI